MEFGRVLADELDKVSFGLPIDLPETTALLKQNQRNAKTEIFVGCAKWGRKDWIGKIYPKGTKEADFLKHYATHFNCIELNATFYKIPTYSQTSAWKSNVDDNFKFCPKFTGSITHSKRLKDVRDLCDRYFEGISGFGKSLGPLFLMPHPGMGPKTADTIISFIEALPNNIDVFVELRHAEWYSNEIAFNDLMRTLQNLKIGTVITDASGRRDCVHMRLTKPEAFIRFVGNGLHPTDYTRVDDWVNRIKLWVDQGINKIYFFMHQHEEIYSPELGKYVIEQLNEKCGSSLRVPQFATQ